MLEGLGRVDNDVDFDLVVVVATSDGLILALDASSIVVRLGSNRLPLPFLIACSGKRPLAVTRGLGLFVF